MNVLRMPLLNRCDLPRVPRELEDRGRLCTSSELGVIRLVAPITELGRLADSHKEVGTSSPPAARERPLINDFRAGAHRINGLVVCDAERIIFLLQVDLDYL